MELDFDKYCILDGSPTTVLPDTRIRLKVTARKSNGKPKCGNETLSVSKEFTEIHFNRDHSASCRVIRSSESDQESINVQKRGSGYQSSKEVNLLSSTDTFLERKKIEFSQENASKLSNGVLDYLCSSDEDSLALEKNRSLSELSETSCGKHQMEMKSRDFLNHSSDPIGQKIVKPSISSPEFDKRETQSNKPKTRYNQFKTILDPFSRSKSMTDTKPAKNSNHNIVSIFSPAHLHGILRLKNRHGMPFFEFSVNSNVYNANIWKLKNGLSWVYTFHCRKKSNNTGGLLSSMVAQMHASCYLDTDSKLGENHNMVTEFVLHDTCNSRKSISSQSNSNFSRPFSSDELHPELEIAAIVMQVPFEKRESLKFKNGDLKIEKIEEGIFDNSRAGKMHVVVPSGTHSFPSNKSDVPSSILDRWRVGGGCDCGGWDMACPLSVFCNENVKILKRDPNELFAQGKKDDIPSFSMRLIEDGKYTVDFHAQLSSLQAFSICVAMLHTAEASGEHVSNVDSSRVFSMEEIHNLIDGIVDEERVKVTRKVEEVLPSFVVDPSFSPIGRI